jgi:hypothetical protein
MARGQSQSFHPIFYSKTGLNALWMGSAVSSRAAPCCPAEVSAQPTTTRRENDPKATSNALRFHQNRRHHSHHGTGALLPSGPGQATPHEHPGSQSGASLEASDVRRWTTAHQHPIRSPEEPTKFPIPRCPLLEYTLHSPILGSVTYHRSLAQLVEAWSVSFPGSSLPSHDARRRRVGDVSLGMRGRQPYM